ncbi:MAG: NADH-quinone oxidoreductase subunit C [Bacteroidota bacterium]
MNSLALKNPAAAPLADLPTLAPEDFFTQLSQGLSAKKRVLSLFAASVEGAVQLFACLGDYTRKRIEVFRAPAPDRYPSLSKDHPALQLFEREIFEQYGIVPAGHPWLKPVRLVRDERAPYPFYAMEGDEIHEVAVGPVHAGVIEPGHFRFQCHGELVHHLEIQLGYQHRGVEELMLAPPLAERWPLAASICGDATIAYAIAHAQLVEALAGAAPRPAVDWTRAFALEMERIAMHLADLAGIATDIAYLPGSAAFGRIRTAAINQLLRLCGSRFGRGWIRPGGVRFPLREEALRDIRETLASVRHDARIMADLMFNSPSVLSRLETTGKVPHDTAAALGLTGFIGRTAGIDEDMRRDLPYGYYNEVDYTPCVLTAGDAWARTALRMAEIESSLALIERMLPAYPGGEGGIAPLGPPAPHQFAIAVVEGWRGGIVHCAITGEHGETVRYKIKDPSFHNWQSLAMALRGNVISDFPLCNKSHDLSYCGVDL